MRKIKIITGLDIGSSQISALSAGFTRDSKLTVLAHATQGSRGVSKGVITNLNDAVSSVSSVLSKLRQKVPGAPGDIYVNISGQAVKGSKSSGMIPLALRGREITGYDMERCASVAGTVHLPFDREIVHRIVQHYSVDDRQSIANPLGLYGSRLSCEVYIITADANHIQNIYKCVNNAGYDLREIVFAGIADGEALLDKEHTESRVLLLDIGASLSQTCVFSNGILIDMEIIPQGTSGIMEAPGDDKRLADLLAAFDAKKRFFGAKSVLLAGGAVFVDSLVELIEERLSCKVKIGGAKETKGDISGADSLRLTTAIGLAKYGCRKRKKTSYEIKTLPARISEKVVDIFNNYF